MKPLGAGSMSMLAERRQKQKWSLNPRGKWWTEDSNKFGQKMLEKMGWTKGKGLGANEQGITEFSSGPYKHDTTGMGFDNNCEVWTEQQEKFGIFLQQLNGNQDKDTVQNGDTNLSDQSIELKSKQSQARVHYKKFTRGKDINKYKSKDLANIFGQKELAEKTQIKIEKSDSICETEVSGFRDDWYGVVTVNGGNMVDYFKLKSNYNNMSDHLKCNIKSNNDVGLSSNTIDNQKIDSESEHNQYVGFGFTQKTEDISSSSCRALKDFDDKSNYAFDNPCLGLNSPTKTAYDNGSFTKSTKKRKKEFESNNLHITEIDKCNNRKKLKTETIDSDCKNGFVNPALNLDIKSEEDCSGKEFEVCRAQFGLENCGLDLIDERTDKKRVTFNDHVTLYEYNINSAKKKKGEATLDKFEVENKKSKKKRKYESAMTPMTNYGFTDVTEAFNEQILDEEINDNELNEHRDKKVKKRKLCKTSNLETIQESPEKEIEINIESEDTLDTSVVENEETDTVEEKSKKKKKKKEKKAKAEHTTTFYVMNEEADIEIEETNRSKKSKKDVENKKEEDITISKKYKKKKKKDKENCKSEKFIIQTEINNEQQDIKILDKSDSKQQNDLIENGNKDGAVIETLSVLMTTEEEEKKPLEKVKHKKKRSIDKENHSSEIDICSIEREISDKENTDKEQDSNAKKLAKRDKKNKKSKDKNVSDVEDSSNSNKEVVNTNVIKQDNIENAELTDTPLKRSKVIDAIDNIINSPWNVKARMSKKMLITLFHNNAISEFPGSNIHNIKGYGTDAESDL